VLVNMTRVGEHNICVGEYNICVGEYNIYVGENGMCW
jgi:hypothetical protein